MPGFNHRPLWHFPRHTSRFLSSVKMLRQGHRLDISCYWLSQSGHGGPTLTPDIMRRLAELVVPVWFDVYFTSCGCVRQRGGSRCVTTTRRRLSARANAPRSEYRRPLECSALRTDAGSRDERAGAGPLRGRRSVVSVCIRLVATPGQSHLRAL